jgi:hypothetical protein
MRHQVIDITNVGDNECDHPLFGQVSVERECAHTIVTISRPPAFYELP